MWWKGNTLLFKLSEFRLHAVDSIVVAAIIDKEHEKTKIN